MRRNAYVFRKSCKATIRTSRNSSAILPAGLQSGRRFPGLCEFFDSMAKRDVPERQRKQLLRSARTAMKNAYAPYSKFRVGSAVLTTTGKVFVGCNVENASYGMTNCAERTAIFSAVAQLGPKVELRAVSVVNDQGVPCLPCGACRQVIYEFGPDATVFFQGADGPKQAHITQLLPEGFRLK